MIISAGVVWFSFSGSTEGIYPSYLSTEEKNWLDDNSENLVCLFGYEDPPQAFTDRSGQYTGVFVDIFRLIEDELGIDISFKMFPAWTDIINYAETGRDFMIVGITPSSERERFLSFTEVIFSRPHVIAASDRITADKIEDLAGLKVAVVGGYMVSSYLGELYPELETIPVKDNHEGLTGVSDGRFDAMITSRAYAIYYIQNEELMNVRIAADIDLYADIAVACSSEDEILASVLRKAVENLSEQEVNESIRGWMVTQNGSTEELRKILSALIAIALMAAAVVLIWVIWIYSLKRTVARQTARIQKDVQEKQLLIKELNHRLKNSLNIVSAMLSIRGENFDCSKETASVLSALNSRITAMAIVYDQLHNAERISSIDMMEFFKLFADKTVSLNSDLPEGCISIDQCNVMLGLTYAVPLAMLSNEIINIILTTYRMNSLEPRIGISFLEKADEYFSLEIDAVAVKNAVSVDDAESAFAKMLIDSYSSQIDASVEVTDTPNLKYRLLFKPR